MARKDYPKSRQWSVIKIVKITGSFTSDPDNAVRENLSATEHRNNLSDCGAVHGRPHFCQAFSS